MRTFISALIVLAGLLISPALGQSPETAPAGNGRWESPLTPYIQAILDSPDPSTAIQMYAKGQTISPNDVGLARTYLRRMVDFGLPEMAEAQARDLIKRDPNYGLAWAVSAYMSAKRGETTQALAQIVPAVKQQPRDEFVLRTAGQLMAWFDTEADRKDVPDAVVKGLEGIRGDLENRSTYTEAYEAALEVYKSSAAAATQPAAGAPPTATQPSAPEEGYPPMSAVPYAVPSESAYEPYAHTTAQPYATAQPYVAAYPYFAASYPSWYPSYGYSYGAAYWWPGPSYWWWWPRSAVVVPRFPRSLVALGLLHHGLHVLHRHHGVLIPPRHGSAIARAPIGVTRGLARRGGVVAGSVRPGIGRGQFGFARPPVTAGAVRPPSYAGPRYRTPSRVSGALSQQALSNMGRRAAPLRSVPYSGGFASPRLGRSAAPSFGSPRITTPQFGSIPRSPAGGSFARPSFGGGARFAAPSRGGSRFSPGGGGGGMRGRAAAPMGRRAAPRR